MRLFGKAKGKKQKGSSGMPLEFSPVFKTEEGLQIPDMDSSLKWMEGSTTGADHDSSSGSSPTGIKEHYGKKTESARIYPGGRHVNVFVSSTFVDMKGEREQLVKHVFPQLRKLCEKRMVTWGEVDLRWGVPTEEKADNNVLPVCIAEIERCKPYFLGILGHRYGWVVQSFDPELIRIEPWLIDCGGRSVTEIEIMYGALLDRSLSPGKFFYLRNPAFLNTLTPERRASYVESPESTAESKLASLKARVLESGWPVREDYENPDELGRLVLKDFRELLDELFPPQDLPNLLDKENSEHEEYALSRFGQYVPRAEYERNLDQHAEGAGPPLAVTGPSGIGKSSLLANWAMRYRKMNPEVFVLLHFVGATPASAEWASMVRRIMGELRRRYDIREEIPEDTRQLRIAFANWLHMVGKQGKTVIALDALDQLQDCEGAQELTWLPASIPDNVRLVFSTLQGKVELETHSRGWQHLEIQPMEIETRHRCIDNYLSFYGKAIDDQLRSLILTSSKTGNPLFLRTLLEELRVHGDVSGLRGQVEMYLSASGVQELCEMVLNRWERDYGSERKNLVRDALTLIWASKNGLSNLEIIEMLSQNGSSLTGAQWYPFYIVADHFLLLRSGLITFSHSYIRQAVKKCYLSDEETEIERHRAIARYFAGMELNPRIVEELPWQLVQSRQYDELVSLLNNPDFVECAWEYDSYALKGYFAHARNEGKNVLLETYQSAMESKDPGSRHVWIIATLLQDFGYLEQSSKLWTIIIEKYRTDDQVHLHAALGNNALCLRRIGQLDEALILHEEEEGLCREADDTRGVLLSRCNQAVILKSKGKLPEAGRIVDSVIEDCHDLRNRDILQAALGIMAIILRARGKSSQAMELLLKKERICRELDNQEGLQASLGNQALVLRAQGELTNADRLLEQQESICRSTGNDGGLAVALGNRALIQKALGRAEYALDLHREEARLCMRMGSKAGLATSQGNQALVFLSRGDLTTANALNEAKTQLCLELENMFGIEASLATRAVLLYECGQTEAALEVLGKQQQICRDLGYPEGLQVGAGLSALLSCMLGDCDLALQLHEQEESICQMLGNRIGVTISRMNRGIALMHKGQTTEAMGLFQGAAYSFQALNHPYGLLSAIGNQAVAYYAKNDIYRAILCCKEQERLSVILEDKRGTIVSRMNLSRIYLDAGLMNDSYFYISSAIKIIEDSGFASLRSRAQGLCDQVSEAQGRV